MSRALRTSGRYLSVAAASLLAACSWMPWHKRHPSAQTPDQASVPASVTSAASVPPPVAVPTATPSDRQTLASISDYSPYTEQEWHVMYANYRALSECEDNYMDRAGLAPIAVARRLIAAGEAKPLSVDAVDFLDAGSNLPERWTRFDTAGSAQQERLVADTLMALMVKPSGDVGLGRELARKAVARYYVAKATQGVCTAPADYPVLMRKPGR
jgi:hypothetical protein